MDENDGWLTDHRDLEIIIQEFILYRGLVILTGNLSLEIRNAAVLASSRDS